MPVNSINQTERDARVRMLYEQLPWALMATLAAAGILALELQDYVPRPQLLIWLGSGLFLVAARAFLRHLYLCLQPPPEKANTWGRLFVLGAALNGAFWGSAGYFFFIEDNLALQLFIAFALAGMTSGAVATLAPLRNLYLVFLIPALVPYLLRLLVSNETISLGMSGMLFVYIVMMGSIARRQHLTVAESLRLRFANVDLLEDLQRAAARQEDANRELAAQVAEKHLAQQALLVANHDLEKRVRERTKELIQSEEALREADRRKDEFLALLGHELRNPLASLSYATQLANHPNAGLEQVQSLPMLIGRQVELLNRLVGDLLDVARINSGKLHLRNDPIDLHDVISRAMETSRPLIEAKHQRLQSKLPPYPLPNQGDLLRLSQVISNLLNNAAKYTDEGGDIFLEVEDEGSDIRIRVRDSGCGIDSVGLPKIFELFYQARIPQDRLNEGLGIGLCIARSLVEAHGGRLEAHSEGVGKGSEFTVHLPKGFAAWPVAQGLSGFSRTGVS